MSNIAVINPETRPTLAAGGKPQAIVPQDMDSAYRLAKAVCMAGMAPKGLDTPEKAMVAIMHGLEIGLTPMAALQRIAVVNGRPTIWGDGAIGLVRGSGLCEWVKERIEGKDMARVAVCEAKRRGEPEPITRTFSIGDAKQAGLWGKAGPWQQYPERMLQMRARAFCLRDGFADVLGGLYIKEELDDTAAHAPPVPPAPPQPAIEHHPEPVQQIAPPTPPCPPKPPAPPAPPKPASFVEKVQEQFPGAEVIADSTDEPINGEAVIDEFTTAADAARDEGTLNESFDDIVASNKARMFPSDFQVCQKIYAKALRRING